VTPAPRSVIVTGGARGIGRSIAEAFSHLGDQVVVVDRDEAALAVLRAEAGRFPGPVALVAGDVGTTDGAQRAAGAALERSGRIDVLCNNAGVRPVGPFLDLEPERFEEALRVNVGGIYQCCRAVLPHMLEQRQGVVVNIASISGLLGYAGGSAYATSKAAAVMLTRILALEFGGAGIRVNCICPGSIDAQGTPGAPPPAAPSVPVGRKGRVDEVASMVLYLASDAAAFVNGAVLTLDGGITAGRPRGA
jgi:NAD(P)-dependent dehydrogenase (short-subunit alcohol dehydrogenase family)